MTLTLLFLLPTLTAGVTLVTQTTTSNATNRYRLYNDLFVKKGYNSKIQPENAIVGMYLHIKSINELDELSETLHTSASMDIRWYEKFLAWNGSDFGGLEYIDWPQDDVWKPDIILYNSDKAYEALGQKTRTVTSFSYGLIKWNSVDVFHTACVMEMTYFPFDVHTCELQFKLSSDDSVKLIAPQNKIGLQRYSENPLWEILETSVKAGEVASDVMSFKLKVQRKPLHTMLTLFVPVLLLTILDLFVFVLPNGGDRSGYAVTVFLAFTVYFTIVDAVMPPNSEKISLFSIYLVIQTCQSTLITIVSVLLTKVEFVEDNTNIPRFLDFLVRISRCRRKTTVEVYALEPVTEGETSERNTVEKDSKDKSEPTTWAMVTDAVDKISLIVFTLLFLTTTVSFFCVIIIGSNGLK